MNLKLYISLLFFCSLITTVSAQVFIDNTYSAEQLVNDFFDTDCVTPSNITFNGNPAQIAYFEGAMTDLGIPAGIVLSTGNVTDLTQVASNFVSSSFSGDGDEDLTNLAGVATNDAAVLEFDISVESTDLETLDFQYIFGSEEYPEFVGSSFNDVFGFFLSGAGLLEGNNIAMIPGTNTIVSINNVNDNMNAEYYVNYATGTDVVFDGITTELFATQEVVGMETYHIKIAVGDAGDSAFDSGVFIGIESLCGADLLTPPADALVEQDGNTVSFVNNSRYATSWSWDFGDNTTSAMRHPDPHTYAENGTYTVTLTTENWCCSDVFTQEIQIGDVAADEAFINQFSLTPNPALDVIQLSWQGDKMMNYTVLNTAGQVVGFGTLLADKTLNIKSLDSGLYFVKLQNEQGSFVEKLLVR